MVKTRKNRRSRNRTSRNYKKKMGGASFGSGGFGAPSRGQSMMNDPHLRQAALARQQEAQIQQARSAAFASKARGDPGWPGKHIRGEGSGRVGSWANPPTSVSTNHLHFGQITPFGRGEHELSYMGQILEQGPGHTQEQSTPAQAAYYQNPEEMQRAAHLMSRRQGAYMGSIPTNQIAHSYLVQDPELRGRQFVQGPQLPSTFPAGQMGRDPRLGPTFGATQTGQKPRHLR